MTLWNPSHCRCAVLLDEEGQPAKMLLACDVHARASHEDVGAESRAISACVNTVAKASGLPQAEVIWSFDHAAQHAAAEVRHPDGRHHTARSKPLDRHAHIAALEGHTALLTR